ncbi:hypothetical protein B0H19DRAFT_1375967 [Mycena capillaripes]|nr:hypothetical protein B0H19DRAFT_1375967 [Mycena capillaripes]
MDPLKPSDYSDALDDWHAFKPNLKGYIPPQSLSLWDGFNDVESQIREFASTDYMRDNDTPFIALSVTEAFPATRITIRDLTFAIPMSPRDIDFLADHLGSTDASRLSVSGAAVRILGDPPDRPSKQPSPREGSHSLSTAARDSTHVVTVFVLLPTFTESVDIHVHATHATDTSSVKFPNDLSQSVGAVGVYAGISDARMDLIGSGEVLCLTYHTRNLDSLLGLMDFFVPKHRLQTGLAFRPYRECFPKISLFGF